MNAQIVELDDADPARARARSFLHSRPVAHNLLLTILEQAIEFSLGGTFWLVEDDSVVTGFALESPQGMGAVLAPMPTSSCRMLAEAIARDLPRVVGEAAGAAAFAGRWTECRATSIADVEAHRLIGSTSSPT